ncbi:MAG TPA: hypothetical protein VNE83_04945 [Terriglobales bacterium]|nr:hypothetical protein [Terriglobales bacterium]
MVATIADQVRELACRQYIEPARRRRQATVRIVAGQVHRALGLRNRARSVCAALTSQIFLQGNRLRLESQVGPPSGESTTMAYTFRILDAPEDASSPSRHPEPTAAGIFHRYRGSGRELFQRLGGGESFIRKERLAWKDRGL